MTEFKQQASSAPDSQSHILVVDDTRDIRELLAKYLQKNGLRVTVAADAAEARRIMASAAIDLVVLDVMMPGEDGLSLCRSIRETTQIPVILLTALGEDTDRIVGLEVGADDYIAKPFNPRELLARIKAVLRRFHAVPPDVRGSEEGSAPVSFDGWTLDLERRELMDRSGEAVTLSSGEFVLLSTLVRHPGVVLSRDRLLDLTRGRDASPFDRSIDNQISRLRRKIEVDPKNPEIIKTVWGGGYVFSGAVAGKAK